MTKIKRLKIRQVLRIFLINFLYNRKPFLYAPIGGETAESTNVLALLLQVGLMQVRILVSARRGKNVWIIGKPPAPN